MISDMTQNDEIIKAEDVGRLLGVNSRTVVRWDFEDKLKPAFRTPGGHRRYRRADILAIMKPEETE
jgi:DNA-binding transcriptional MerR regulator